MKKAFPYLLLAALAITALLVKRCRNSSSNKKSVATVNRNTDLDRNTALLEYSEHARCRMGCLRVSTHVVETILQNGQLNNSITATGARPCPIYALEGYAADSLHLRIIFAQCDYKTKVITCVAIDSVFDCNCSGAGAKYEH